MERPLHSAIGRFSPALVIALLVACIAPRSADGQAAREETFVFWVIGPTAPMRHWASEWVEAALRTSTERPRQRIVEWREALLPLLDVDPPDSLGPPPPGGPFLSDVNSEDWPWDMTQELPVDEIRDRMRAVNAAVAVQITVGRDAQDLVTMRDSAYWVTATAVMPSGTTTRSRRYLTTSARVRTVSNTSLKRAAEELARELVVLWQDMLAVRDERKR